MGLRCAMGGESPPLNRLSLNRVGRFRGVALGVIENGHCWLVQNSAQSVISALRFSKRSERE
jgi:uncharacterized protein YlzI (FlbEa/FlbD family)